MKKRLLSLLFAMCGLSMLRAQGKLGSIVVKLDPALDGIVAPDTKLEKLFSGQ
jgi:hypothetical protein